MQKQIVMSGRILGRALSFEKPTKEETLSELIGYELIHEDEISPQLLNEHWEELKIKKNDDPEGRDPCYCAKLVDGDCGGDECLNRFTNVACPDDCVPDCQNNPWDASDKFQLGISTYAFWEEKKGYGIKAMQEMKEGTWIAPYNGVVVKNLEDITPPDALNYVFEISMVKQYINPYSKGNGASLINHSCYPNCDALQYRVGGKYCIVIRTNRVIEKDEELTFSYGLEERNGGKLKECFCGQPGCKGKIGIMKDKRPTSTSTINTHSQVAQDVSLPIEPEQSTPTAFPSILYTPEQSIQDILRTPPATQTRPVHYEENFIFGPLSVTYFYHLYGDNFRVSVGRVVECFQNSAKKLFYVIYTSEGGPSLVYLPRFFVYHYVEDAIANLKQHAYSKEDIQRMKSYLTPFPSNERSMTTYDAVCTDFEIRFEANTLPKYKARLRSFTGARAIGLSYIILDVMDNGDGVKNEDSTTEKYMIMKPNLPKTQRPGEMNTDSVLVEESSSSSLTRTIKMALPEYVPSHYLPVGQVVLDNYNSTGLFKTIGHASTEITLIVLARMPQKSRSYSSIYQQVHSDLLHSYAQVAPKFRRFLTFNHYSIAIENEVPGSHKLQWCPLCVTERNYAHACDLFRHYLRHHSIVSKSYCCPKTTCRQKFDLPSTFRKHVAGCAPSHALEMMFTLDNYIMDSYSDFLGKKGSNNIELHLIEPGIPNTRVGKDVSHEAGQYSTKMKQYDMDILRRRPISRKYKMEKTTFLIQKSYKNFTNWEQLRKYNDFGKERKNQRTGYNEWMNEKGLVCGDEYDDDVYDDQGLVHEPTSKKRKNIQPQSRKEEAPPPKREAKKIDESNSTIKVTNATTLNITERSDTSNNPGLIHRRLKKKNTKKETSFSSKKRR